MFFQLGLEITLINQINQFKKDFLNLIISQCIFINSKVTNHGVLIGLMGQKRD